MIELGSFDWWQGVVLGMLNNLFHKNPGISEKILILGYDNSFMRENILTLETSSIRCMHFECFLLCSKPLPFVAFQFLNGSTWTTIQIEKILNWITFSIGSMLEIWYLWIGMRLSSLMSLAKSARARSLVPGSSHLGSIVMNSKWFLIPNEFSADRWLFRIKIDARMYI